MLSPVPHLPLARRVLFDRLTAGGYALLIAAPVLKDARSAAGILVALAILLAFALPLTLRRSHLGISFAVCLAGMGLATLAERTAAPFGLIPMAACLYLAAALCRLRIAVGALVTCIAAAASASLADTHGDGGAHNGGAVAALFAFTVVWIVGYVVGVQRRRTGDLLRDQARQAQVELETSRRAVAEERIRIARELHDVVAHSMSVITVQAAYGSLVIDETPAGARAALDAIETTGRQALTEMRQLLGVLREDGARSAAADPTLAPAPGLADLDRLAEQTAQAGVHVDLAVLGPARALPPGIDLSAYRIVQEALTNVVKHAATPQARVVLEYRQDELAIDVTDAGRGCPGTIGPDWHPPLPGHGLTGMRERALLYGGSFHAGPLPGHGFHVAALLPLAPVALLVDSAHVVAGIAGTAGAGIAE